MAKRGWVYLDGDLVVYRASSIGACLRGLVAARQGLPPTPRPEVVQNAMDASSKLERATVLDLEELGYEVAGQQREVELPITVEDGHPGNNPSTMFVVRGHIDGIADSEAGACVLEIKNLGPDLWTAYHNRGLEGLRGLGQQYLWQMSAYMLATKMPGLLVCRNKRTKELSMDRWEEPPVQEFEITNRIMTVEYQYAQDELPECDRKCTSFDPYWHIHEKPVVIEGDEELAGQLTRYWNVKDAIDHLQDELKDMGDALKKELRPGTKWSAGGFKAVVSHVRTNRADTGWIRRNHPDVYEASLKPSESLRLQVTRENDDAADPAE